MKWLFEQKLQEGRHWEQALDAAFRFIGTEVIEAGPELQQWGVDRIHRRVLSEEITYSVSVEYKTDLVAVRSGNLFLEHQIRTSDGAMKSGWLFKTIAQTLVFLLPQKKRFITMDTLQLKSFALNANLRESPWVENFGGFAAKGLLLPIRIGRQEIPSWYESEIDI